MTLLTPTPAQLGPQHSRTLWCGAQLDGAEEIALRFFLLASQLPGNSGFPPFLLSKEFQFFSPDSPASLGSKMGEVAAPAGVPVLASTVKHGCP